MWPSMIGRMSCRFCFEMALIIFYLIQLILVIFAHFISPWVIDETKLQNNKALKFNTPKELYIYNVKDIWANKTTLLRSDLTTAGPLFHSLRGQELEDRWME